MPCHLPDEEEEEETRKEVNSIDLQSYLSIQLKNPLMSFCFDFQKNWSWELFIELIIY